MLQNLSFSFSRVLPFFLLIVLGFLLRRRKVLPPEFFTGANRFVYRVALPVNLFLGTARINWHQDVDMGFIRYLFTATLISFCVIWLLCEILYRDNKGIIGTMVQGAFRGNYAILGTPLILAVLGESFRPAADMAVAVLIPVYSLLSVLVLQARNCSGSALRPKALLLSVVSNPLIVGTAAGFAWNFTGLPLPLLLENTMEYLSATVTGLGLLSIGGIFHWRLAKERIWPSVVATLLKTVVAPLLVLLVSYLLGYGGWQMFFLLVLFANPTSVSSYTIAAELEGDAPLAANILILTTLFSSLVLALGITVMRTMGWI